MTQPILRVKTPKKKLSQTKIKIRRNQLLKLYAITKSWRAVQRDYYPEVSFQALQAFSDKSRKYIPANETAREALDIYADENPYKSLPRWYKRTPEALEYWNKKREQIKTMSDEAKRQRQSRNLRN